MPLLLFWKQCSMKTASSNPTVYTARYVPPASFSTTSRTPATEALEGFCGRVLVTVLCEMQCVAEELPRLGC
jgi:hypothetical protein